MRISKPEISRSNGFTRHAVRVESARGKETLWYSTSDAFGGLLSSSSDACLVALLIPAMALGEALHIEGSVSDRLFYNLSGSFQELIRRIIPALHRIPIYAEHLSDRDSGSVSGVATGFSGGIDSYCVLADHYYGTTPDRFKVTHLIFSNVGSHGIGGERLFRDRYQRLMPAAERMGIPFIAVNSNLDSFYGGQLNFQQTHTVRNASVALLLQGAVRRYMYASTLDYSHVFLGPKHAIAHSDAVSLPMLSTDSMDIFSVGGEYTRVQKTLRVAELSDSYDRLDVCVNAKNTSGYTNCSTCWKCLRTLCTLEIAGYLDRYAAVFDLNAYRACRTAYFAEVLGSRDALLMEVAQFARDRNYAIPSPARVKRLAGSALVALPRRVMNIGKRLLTQGP